MADQHEWIAKLVAELPQEKVCARLKDDNPHWEFIDGEMVKLGALAHGSLDLPEIQQRILLLLATESKDFRLVVHLLRTLQHAGRPQDVILALQLLCAWVKDYWELAWPDNALMKRRLAQQVIKRFHSAANLFVEQSNSEQRQEVLGELAHLAQLWQTPESGLAKEVDALGTVYRRQPERAAEPEVNAAATAGEKSGISASAVASQPDVAAPPPMDIDSSSEKAWRQTQLQMAEILCDRHPDNPLGYRLRRHAIWHGISGVPQAQADGRTPLAAFSADRMAGYLEGSENPNRELWKQVEQSLSLAPYWFDGHRISALIAKRLGYERVAVAICEELSLFLARLPQLKTLSFTDRSPFLSAETQSWLDALVTSTASVASVPQVNSDIDKAAIWQCWQQQGLEAALGEIDAHAQRQNARGRFYCQLLSTQLLEEAGMAMLARQNYQQLWQAAQGIVLSDWEPDLIVQLEQQINSKE